MTTHVPVGFATASLVWKATHQSRQSIITLGVVFDGFGTPLVRLSQIVGAFIGVGGIMDLANVSSDYNLVRSHILANTPAGLLSAVIEEEFSGTGGLTVTPPADLTVRMHKQTLFAGRRFRGVCQLPPCMLNSAAIDNGGNIDDTTMTRLQDGAQSTYDTITAAMGAPVLLHEPSIHSATPPPTTITHFTVGSKVGTNKRRTR